eukprot:CAMPEP_0113273978 /NCGR_PEP_ID=MMETSP0008_2-20120614/24149_1 /TAXON_ID=97485 /ORGANISM="Prymnesium parvum" /LENGTH=119 /DNA_ID=CAMNT_0000123551 /DNA_START=476 /DNA_END=836 /DNA_ORIENTATION=+ /assembly_acc=CAM_ASM_000153
MSSQTPPINYTARGDCKRMAVPLLIETTDAPSNIARRRGTEENGSSSRASTLNDAKRRAASPAIQPSSSCPALACVGPVGTPSLPQVPSPQLNTIRAACAEGIVLDTMSASRDVQRAME